MDGKKEKKNKYCRIYQNDGLVDLNQRRKAANDRAIFGAGAATPFPSRSARWGSCAGPAAAPVVGAGRERGRSGALDTRAGETPGRPAPAPSAARATLWPPPAPARAYLSSHSNERRLNRTRNIAGLGYPERAGPWLCAGSGRGKIMGEGFVHLCWEGGESLLCGSDR